MGHIDPPPVGQEVGPEPDDVVEEEDLESELVSSEREASIGYDAVGSALQRLPRIRPGATKPVS
jgi:hypothetical protein